MSRCLESMRFPALTLLAAVAIQAHQAPVARSWRSLGMGGAGVAVVDDAEAIHLNPAGLSQIGWKGSFKPLDTLGYKRNKVDIQGAFDIDPNVESLLDLKSFFDRYSRPIDSAANGDPLALFANQQLVDDLYAFDRKPMNSSVTVEGAVALHDLGFGFWSRNEATLLIDHGAITPKTQLRGLSTNAIEVATSQAFLDDRLSLGVGYRIAAISGQVAEYDLVELDSLGLDAAKSLVWKTEKGLLRTGDWGHGLDLGVLWFQNPSLRWGASVRDLGMKLGGGFVTPNLTLGLAWAPRALQSNQLFWRRVNLGFALEDILWDTLGYKPLSKIDFGAEFQALLVPKGLTVGLSGGFKGGYPTAMVSLLLLSAFKVEALTYAEETGWSTGDREDRRWVLRLGCGI